MPRSLNKAMIIGNIGKDPEMRYTPNGQAVTTFSVAVSRSGKDKQEETEWFSVVAWGKLAETCNQYLTKGQKVYIEGRIQTRTWDGNDGQKHYKTELIANEMLMLDRKNGIEKEWSAPAADEPDDSDLPF